MNTIIFLFFFLIYKEDLQNMELQYSLEEDILALVLGTKHHTNNVIFCNLLCRHYMHSQMEKKRKCNEFWISKENKEKMQRIG